MLETFFELMGLLPVVPVGAEPGRGDRVAEPAG